MLIKEWTGTFLQSGPPLFSTEWKHIFFLSVNVGVQWQVTWLFQITHSNTSLLLHSIIYSGGLSTWVRHSLKILATHTISFYFTYTIHLLIIPKFNHFSNARYFMWSIRLHFIQETKKVTTMSIYHITKSFSNLIEHVTRFLYFLVQNL